MFDDDDSCLAAIIVPDAMMIELLRVGSVVQYAQPDVVGTGGCGSNDDDDDDDEMGFFLRYFQVVGDLQLPRQST